MYAKVTGAFEGFATLCTFKGLFAAVGPFVRLEEAVTPEGFPTLRTVIPLFSSMGSFV